jgi:hypothetical protein
VLLHEQHGPLIAAVRTAFDRLRPARQCPA